VHLGIQRSYLHLIVEAKHRVALARGMQGFSSSVARLINSATGHVGQVFADRYHTHVLKTPDEVSAALAQVLDGADARADEPDALCLWAPKTQLLAARRPTR